MGCQAARCRGGKHGNISGALDHDTDSCPPFGVWQPNRYSIDDPVETADSGNDRRKRHILAA
jgi:hypothetical protein